MSVQAQGRWLFYIILSLTSSSETITQQPWTACPSRNQKTALECACHQPENLGIAQRRIIKYYENGCFDKELSATIQKAKNLFIKPAAHDKQVVVFDIDETVLSDYCNIKAIQFGYIPKLSNKWINQANAPAIPAMKDFYNYLLDKGYRVIFLTGRHHHQYVATEKNLRDQGFTTYDALILRSAEDKPLTAKEYKSRERAKLTQQGYEIVGTVGDQLSDLAGNHTGKRIKIPNYMYFIE